MAVTITDYDIALVSLKIGDITTPPMFAIFADLQGVLTGAHSITVPAQAYIDMREYWKSNAIFVGIQRKGAAALNVLNDLTEVNIDDGTLAIKAYYHNDGATSLYDVIIDALYNGVKKTIWHTTDRGGYIGSSSGQRISSGYLLVDTESGKVACYGTALNAPSGATLPTTTANPNPWGVGVTSNGFPIAIGPDTYSTPINYTIQTFEPYLIGVGQITPIKELDPYSGGGFSEIGGGTGTFENTGADVDFPPDPSLSSVDTGFITLFNPTKGQLKSLANYMWSTGFDLDTFKKLFANPMDAILGMSIVPVAVPNGGNKEVKVGNISTGVQMNEAASQFVSVDCGSITVEEYWGAYLDYSPYTKAEIYLPYIGTHAISVDDIMGKTVHIKYKVDILSGACCAYIKCGGTVLYSFVGQCSCSIPITGNDWTNVVNGALSIAASIGSMVATGGASAPMSTAAIASTAVNAMKPNVEKSGSMGGMGGMMGIQKPYLILTRPRQALPDGQSNYMGYPSFITVLLDEVEGYTEVESIHLEKINATQQELIEIEGLLKSGVIF